MAARHKEFLSQEDIARPLAIASIVGSLKSSIESHARIKKIGDAKRAVDMTVSYNFPNIKYPAGMVDPRRQAEMKQRSKQLRESLEHRYLDNMASDDLDEAAIDAWDDYQDKLRQGEPDNWFKHTYQPLLATFDQECIVPLVEAHQAWFFGQNLRQVMVAHHDDRHVESGAGYVQSLLWCLQDTQQYKLCFDNYHKSMAEDENSLLLHGLALNQQSLMQQLHDAVPASGIAAAALATLPWKNLLDSYKESTEQLSEGGRNLLTQLIAAIGGPLTKLFNQAIDGTVGRFLVATSLVSGSALSLKTYQGKLSDVLDVLVADMKRLNPALEDVDASLLKRELKIESKGKRQVTPTHGANGRFNGQEVTIKFNRFELQKIDAHDANAAKRAAKTILSLDEMPKQGIERFKTLFGTNSRLATVGLILDTIGAVVLGKSLDKVFDAHHTLSDKLETSGVFSASVLAVTSGSLDIAGKSIEGLAKSGNIRMSAQASKIWAGRAAKLSVRLAFGAATIMAVVDGYETYKEAKKGHKGLAALHFMSAVSGFFAPLMLSAGEGLFVAAGMEAAAAAALATGVGVALLLIALACGLLIAYLTNDALQDWLERCYFGNLHSSHPFASLQEAMQQFKQAVDQVTGKAPKESAQAGMGRSMVPAL